jgi:opacity protein-like surface antigen
MNHEGGTMKHPFITLACLGMSVCGALAQGAAEPRARVDVGGGVSFIGAEIDVTSDTEQGFGVTLGVLFKNGFLLRFNVAQASSTTSDTFNIGFGYDVFTEDDTLIAGDATAGYLWLRNGMVRPYLRGGLAFIQFESQIDSMFSGSFGPSSDVDQVLTYGGGVEVGKKHHMVALDVQKMTQASLDLDGLEVDVSVSVISLQYRYRF